MGWEDDRAVSEVLGAMLLFGILVLAIGSYQAFIVPQANEEIEFKHNQEVQGEMQELRSIINTVETSDSSGSQTISTGADYPARLLAINSPPAAGSVRTVGTTDNTNVTIENAVATNEDAADWWNGDAREFRSGQLVYQPNYNYYQNGPKTVIDHSIVYNEFGDGTQLTTTDQRLIQGNRIRLGTLGGDRSFSRSKSTIDVTPVSAGTTTTTVEATGDYLNITIPSELTADEWDKLLSTQDNVENVTETSGGVKIWLNGTQTYNLEMSRVSVGPAPETSEAHYLVAQDGDGQFIQQNKRSSVTVQVRDRYNNPVSGVNVTFKEEGGLEELNTLESHVKTDENGRATAKFTTSDVNTTVTITASAKVNENPTSSEDDRREASFEINVGPFDSGDAGQLNPNDAILTDQVRNQETLTLSYRAVDEDVNVTQLRYNLFFYTGGTGDVPESITDMRVGGSGSLTEEAQRGGGFVSLDGNQGQITKSDTSVELTFSQAPKGGQRALLAITFYTDEGKRLQYLIGLEP